VLKWGIKKISIKSLISTRGFLARIIQDSKSDYERVSAIQALKNTIRKLLLLRAQEVGVMPKEIFRLAGLEGLISDAEV